MPANTSSSQDKIINNAVREASTLSDTVSELLAIIYELDDKLSKAMERISELEGEVVTLEDKIRDKE